MNNLKDLNELEWTYYIISEINDNRIRTKNQFKINEWIKIYDINYKSQMNHVLSLHYFQRMN